jgi:hypothetical protein
MPSVNRRIAVSTVVLVITAVGVAVPSPLAAAVVGIDPGSVELTPVSRCR